MENTETSLAAQLSPHEVLVLKAFAGSGEREESALEEACELESGQWRRAVEWLKAKGCLAAEETGRSEWVSLAEGGKEVLARGSTAELDLLVRLERAGGKLPPAECQRLEGYPPDEAGKALGNLKKAGAVVLAAGTVETTGKGGEFFRRIVDLVRQFMNTENSVITLFSSEEQTIIRTNFKKRGGGKGLFHIQEKPSYRFRLTPEGETSREYWQARGFAVASLQAMVTSAQLKQGSWKEAAYRPFTITDNAPRRLLGRKHPYRQFLDEVKGRLAAMGFVEMTGDLVETEFWDMDALFMPQFHPAREIHDIYYVKEPKQAREIPQPYLRQVAEAHEQGGGTGSRGWRYRFDLQRTKQLVLRSQGTALSARTLASQPATPGKYFAMARCFRPDVVDATHAPDFFQVEGIVLGEEIAFRELLGLLKLFALEMARAEEMFFAPAYFPFTEPSVEVHMKHPRLGWMELGGAGLFRPEVTRPLGVEVPVIAWGLGLDRMAMMALGIDDIRQLFSTDLNFIRSARLPAQDAGQGR